MTIYSKFLGHYQHACREHPGFMQDEKFSETMRMAQEFYRGDKGNGSPSFFLLDVLNLVTSYVTQNIKEVSEEIIRYNQDVGDAAQLLHMVRSYFCLCRTTMNTINRLQIKLAKIARCNRPEKEAVRCVEDVVQSSIVSLTDLIGNHVTILTELQQARDKDMPIGVARPETETYPNMGTIILVSVFATAVICSILVASFHMPPGLVALPAAVISITSFGPFIEWANGLWKQKPSASMRELQLRLLMDITLPIKLDDESKKRVPAGTLSMDVAKLVEQIEKCRSEILKAEVNLCKKMIQPIRRRDRARRFFSRQADKLREKKEELFENVAEKFEEFTTNVRT